MLLNLQLFMMSFMDIILNEEKAVMAHVLEIPWLWFHTLASRAGWEEQAFLGSKGLPRLQKSL